MDLRGVPEWRIEHKEPKNFCKSVDLMLMVMGDRWWPVINRVNPTLWETHLSDASRETPEGHPMWRVSMNGPTASESLAHALAIALEMQKLANEKSE